MNILVREVLRRDERHERVYRETAILDYDRSMASPEYKMDEDLKEFANDHANMDTFKRVEEKGVVSFPVISPKHRIISSFESKDDPMVTYNLQYSIYNLGDLVKTQTPISVVRYEEEL